MGQDFSDTQYVLLQLLQEINLVPNWCIFFFSIKNNIMQLVHL